jgi:hypothetical protein
MQKYKTYKIDYYSVMGIVSLTKKYKMLGYLNKYSLLLAYGGVSLFLFSIFYFLKFSGTYLIILFISISLYLVYFIFSKRKRSKDYNFDCIFPLRKKDYLLVEFSSIFCAGCLPIRKAVDRISNKYDNIQVVQIEARNIEIKYLNLVNELKLSLTPTICLLDKNGKLISKGLAHLNPENIDKNLEALLINPVT